MSQVHSLHLRTFHVGGTASKIADDSRVEVKYDGILEIDELRTVDGEDRDGNKVTIVVGRSAEARILDPKTNIALTTNVVPYGSILTSKDGAKVKKGDMICHWDPYNALIIAETAGTVSFENLVDGITYKEESDEQTGFTEKVITESRDKKLIPEIKLINAKKEVIKTYNLACWSTHRC